MTIYGTNIRLQLEFTKIHGVTILPTELFLSPSSHIGIEINHFVRFIQKQFVNAT